MNTHTHTHTHTQIPTQYIYNILNIQLLSCPYDENLVNHKKNDSSPIKVDNGDLIHMRFL